MTADQQPPSIRARLNLTAIPTRGEIMAARIKRGKRPGWSRKQLAEWGVPWPPPAGWIDDLERRRVSVAAKKARQAAAGGLASDLAPVRAPTQRERRDARKKPKQWKAIERRKRTEVAAARRRNHAELNPGRPLVDPAQAVPAGLVVSAGKAARPGRRP